MAETKNDARNLTINDQAKVQVGNSYTTNHYGKHPQRRAEIGILRELNACPYQDRKDRNPDRVQDTCEWFVSHQLFQEWRKSQTSTMLWVTADPGCGKSVLAKYLVDHILPTSNSRTMCYFFFKDDFEDQRNINNALCCILRQLFMQKRSLLSSRILDQFEADGDKFTSSFGSLWQTLLDAAKDNATEIICLLDAIDECEDKGRIQLAEELCRLFRTKPKFNLKFLVTSRSYGTIQRSFQPIKVPGVPNIHLSGESEEEMIKISKEIDVFITARVQDIGARLHLTTCEQNLLLERLKSIPHRTYLWVHLTLDLIEKDIEINKDGIIDATSHLPTTVDEAYNRILRKSQDSEKAKRLLHIVVAAARPLTLREMSFALGLHADRHSYEGLDIKPEDRFRIIVRDNCGLFITIIDSKIYLLHQTAKEFLVQDEAGNSPQLPDEELEWKHALELDQSHRILAEICIWNLLFTEFEKHPLTRDEELAQYVKDHVFLDYSAKHWAAHLREIRIKTQDKTTQAALKICDVSSRRYMTWFRIYWTSTNTTLPSGFTSLMVASYFGLRSAVKELLSRTPKDINCQDLTYRRSALSWAAMNGYDDVVKLLLIKGARINMGYLTLPIRKKAKVDTVDKYGRTPLSYAVWNGNLTIIKLLVKANAQVDLKDEIGGTPLSYAVCKENNEIIDFLVKKGSSVTSSVTLEDNTGSLLLSAARKGHEAVVTLLLDTGNVDINAKDHNGQAALWCAARNGHEAIVKLLLDTGKVDIDVKDKDGQTPLSCAARNGHGVVVKLLLDTGKVDINAKHKNGQTPLSCAAKNKHRAVVKMLLDTGKADVETTDRNGQSPLSHATKNGDEAMINLLRQISKGLS